MHAIAAALLVACAGASITIRPVQPAELAAFARFRAAAFAAGGEASPQRLAQVHRLVEDRAARGSTMLCAVADGADADLGAAEAPEAPFWAKLLKGAPGSTLDQTLEDGSRVVGVCDVSRHEFDLPTHSLPLDYGLYLTALAVHPQLRRRGVASRLLEAAEARARDAGLERVVLHVEEDNPEAIAFYAARDFSRVKADKELRQFGTALGLNPELHGLFTKQLGS